MTRAAAEVNLKELMLTVQQQKVRRVITQKYVYPLSPVSTIVIGLFCALYSTNCPVRRQRQGCSA